MDVTECNGSKNGKYLSKKSGGFSINFAKIGVINKFNKRCEVGLTS